MKQSTKNKLLYLVSSHLGRIKTSLFFTVLFITLRYYANPESTAHTIYTYAMLAFLTVPVGYLIYMIATAWIINPIKSLIKKKK